MPVPSMCLLKNDSADLDDGGRIEMRFKVLIGDADNIIAAPAQRSSFPPETTECGIGMELEYQGNMWCVAGVRPGGPAATVGVMPGMQLVAVDWHLVHVSLFVLPRAPFRLCSLQKQAGEADSFMTPRA